MDGTQQATVDRLIELTNGEADEEVARSVLSSVDWDVQRAADLLFGHAPSNTMQPFDIDDSLQPAPRPRHRPLWSWLTLPFHLLTSIVRFIFGVLRIPLPRFATLTFYLPLSRRGNSASAPPKGPEAWLRQLEDETGAISVGRIRPRASASGVASSTASSSADASLSSRARAAGDEDHDTDGRKRLPDFVLSSYEDFLRTCQRDARIGCVILVSAEHDDVPEFKRSTLTDSTFIKALQDNNILVWGGDVRDREAWSASEKLQATTYPFVAFLALQPQRGSRSSTSLLTTSSSPSNDPTLTVLSRHQGPAAPSAYTPSPSASTSTTPNQHEHTPTSAPALVAHLQTALLPRVAPYLASLLNARQSAHLALQRTRQLRAEQDAAFAASAARDRARIEARIAEEREAKERAVREKAEEERRLREEAERKRDRERREMERGAWRTWARRAIVQPLKDSSSTAGGRTRPPTLRVAVRLPSGTRIIHTFDVSGWSANSSPTLTTLFALVDAAFIPDSVHPESDPTLPPVIVASSASPSSGDKPTPESTLDAHILSILPPSSSSSPTKTPATAEHAFWAFRLLTAYPRAELPWSASTPLSTVSLLNPPAIGASGKNANASQGGAQLVVELVSSPGVDGEGGGGRRSGEGRRSTDGQRRSVDAGNGIANGNGISNAGRDTGSSAKGKGREAPPSAKEEEEEDSDDGYRTESSDEE